MTDPGDEKLSRRYRELAREEPPAALDAAILAKARESRARDDSRVTGVRPPRWMGPVSIAAVLVLGIGVSLRMQLETPGIETSAPSASSAEYPLPPSAEPAAPSTAPEPAPAPAATPAEQAQARQSPAPAVRARKDAAATLQKEKKADTRDEAEVAKPMARNAEIAAPAGVLAPPPAPKLAAEPAPLAERPIAMQRAPTPAAPPAPAAAAPPSLGAAAPQSAPLRAKREAFATDRAAAESRRAAAAPDPDPERELERIARLREAARHDEADRALEAFRRNHPDFRIPPALWERVKPR